MPNKLKTWSLDTWSIIKLTISNFSDLNITRMAAALAYYTIFAIAPVLILIIRFTAIFAQRQTDNTIYEKLEAIVGGSAADQIKSMIQNAINSNSSGIAYIISIVALVFSATSIFAQIQSSINEIWRIRIKPSSSLKRLVINRLISFGMLIGLSCILVLSLLINAILSGLSDFITKIFPDFSVVSAISINLAVTFISTTALFFGIYKFLPDAKVNYKDVLIGAIITAILFMLGRWGIGLYLAKSKISSTYGAAGSLIILLLWIYYSSIIIFVGAIITRVQSEFFGRTIVPKEYAELIQTITTNNRLKKILKNKEVV